MFLVGRQECIIGNVYEGINELKKQRLKNVITLEVEECVDCKLKACCPSTRCLLVNYVTNGKLIAPNLVECNMMNVKYDIATERNDKLYI